MHNDIVATISGKVCDQSKTLEEKEKIFNKMLDEIK